MMNFEDDKIAKGFVAYVGLVVAYYNPSIA